MRASGTADIRAGLQSEALLHSESMLAALRQTTLAGLSIRSDATRPGFAVTPLRTVTSSGQRVWSEHLTMYYWVPVERSLFRQECPPASLPAGLSFLASQPPRLDPAELNAMFDDGRRLSSRVTDFEVSLLGPTLHLKLALEQAMPSAHAQTYEIVRETTLESP
jgi:hypothetical protein